MRCGCCLIQSVCLGIRQFRWETDRSVLLFEILACLNVRAMAETSGKVVVANFATIIVEMLHYLVAFYF